MTARRWLAVLLALPAGAALAADGEGLTGRGGVDQFLERSYIGPRVSASAERDGFDLFEAQIAPHFFFHQEVGALLKPHAPGWAPQGWSAAFVPLFRLRMTLSDSNPVRTPSFNPHLVGQVFWTWGALPFDLSPGEQGTPWRWPAGKEGPVALLGVQYTVAHHSNGQQGCTFLSAKLAGGQDPSCAAADFSQGQPITNTIDGNFGTNYETLGVFVKWFWLDDAANRQVNAVTLGASYERHDWTLVAERIPGALGRVHQGDLDFRRIFGTHRVALTAEGEVEPGLPGIRRLRATVALTGISAASDVGPTGRAAAEVAAYFPGRSGLGVFVRGFYGHDYYNIRLQDRAGMLLFGLTWDVHEPQVFLKPDQVVRPGRHQPPPRTIVGGGN